MQNGMVPFVSGARQPAGAQDPLEDPTAHSQRGGECSSWLWIFTLCALLINYTPIQRTTISY